MAIKASNQISIVDVTDAYSVMLSSEAYTFAGGVNGATSGACATQVQAFCGTTRCLTVHVDTANLACPTGISASVTNNDSSEPTITFTISNGSTISTDCEATIPIKVDDVSITKKFSFSVSKQGATGATGATGRGISSTVIEYVGSSSNTTIPSSSAGWQSSIPPVSAGNYLWTKTTINYTSGDPSISYSVAKQGSTGITGSQWYSGTGITGTSTTATIFSGSGVSSAKVNDMYLNTSTGNTYKCTVAGAASAAKWVYTGNIKGATGSTGATGNGISSVTIKYAKSTSNTSAPTSGWEDDPVAVDPGSYLWTKTTFTYTNGGSDIQYSVAKQGATGAAGADAITLTITSSDSIIFKNSTGTTTLTAVVRLGEEIQTVSDSGVCGTLGTVKWYLGSGTQGTGWPKSAKSIKVGASSGNGIDVVVTDVAAVICQLEA